jgi:hypothetical protein
MAVVDSANRAALGPVEVISYLDLIAGRCQPPPPGSLVRIESPSECDATTRAILKAGAAPLIARGQVPLWPEAIDRLAIDRGEIVRPRQWFLGYQAILTQLEAAWAAANVRWMSRPGGIISAFDKLDCLERWSHAGLPVPRRFSCGANYAEIRREIRERHARVFVKLRHGYSAMGAVALEWRDSLVRAITPMDIVWSQGRSRLFVSKRPRVITREHDIAWLIDLLAKEEILVEQWLPKARWNGKPYDARVVVIAGKARHVVGRAHCSPFTNLNLDATRIPADELQRRMGTAWTDFESIAEQAASLIPGAGALGLDILVRPCRRQFVLLEANAFGDYLPGLMHREQSTYDAEWSEFSGALTGVAA